MKKIIGISTFIFLMGIAGNVYSQTKANEVGQDIKKGAKKVGNKTAEVASKEKQRLRMNVIRINMDQMGKQFTLIIIQNIIG